MADIVRFFLLAAVGLAGCGPTASAGPTAARRTRLDAAYARQLADLAEWCRAHDLDREAATTAAWLPPRDPNKLCLFVVGRQGRDTEPVAGPDGMQAEWNARFQALRCRQAEALWQLAQLAIAEEHVARACQLATEAVREDPDHTGARRMLGYEQIDDVWCTDFARRQRQRGYVWHDRFGWLKKQYVSRYEAGARRFEDGWIDAEEDARRRQRISDGWRVRTGHFLVTTDDSLEGGVQLATRLERFHQIWRQVFTGYYLDGKGRQKLRDDRPPPRPQGAPHAIYYFRTRAEYNKTLRRHQPRIDMTLGIYFDTLRRGYFFAGDHQSSGTLYHEATHQLFHETRRVAKQVGRRCNFWIVEGIATYMESLTERGGYWTLGGLDTGRVPAARKRLLEDGYYVPLAHLTRMGVEDLQQRTDLGKLYSQVAGLTTFLAHGGGGRYRRALVEYLARVYSDTADAGTLARLTGTSYDQLDSQYRAFLARGE